MGLGPAHAVAGSCSDQGLHHGMLSGIGCVATLDAVLARVPHKRAALADALGLHIQASASAALTALLHRLGLPATLAEAGYHAPDPAELARAAHASPFNKASRWHPSAREYQDLIEASLSGRIPGATPA
jgi:alcohol dehydrogenase class IV